MGVGGAGGRAGARAGAGRGMGGGVRTGGHRPARTAAPRPGADLRIGRLCRYLLGRCGQRRPPRPRRLRRLVRGGGRQRESGTRTGRRLGRAGCPYGMLALLRMPARYRMLALCGRLGLGGAMLALGGALGCLGQRPARSTAGRLYGPQPLRPGRNLRLSGDVRLPGDGCLAVGLRLVMGLRLAVVMCRLARNLCLSRGRLLLRCP